MSPLSLALSSARHPRIVIAAWALVFAISIGIAALGPDVVAGISQYYHSGSDYRVSDSGHSTIMTVTMAGTLDESRANVPSVLDVVRRHGGKDDFTVRVVGESTIADRVADLVYSFSLIPLFLAFIPAIMASRPALRLPILVGLVSVIIPVGLSV